MKSDFLNRGIACDPLLFELCWRLCNLTDFIIDWILLVDCNTPEKLLCGLREAVRAVSCSVQNAAPDSTPHPSSGVVLHPEPLEVPLEPSRHLWGGAQRFLWVLCGAFLGVFHAVEQSSGVEVPTWALSPQGEWMHQWLKVWIKRERMCELASVNFAADHCIVLWSKQMSKSVRKQNIKGCADNLE